MSEMYKRFAPSNLTLDFSEVAADDFYNFESRGDGDFKHGVFGTPPFNGFHVGKHWMDITIGMWKETKREFEWDWNRRIFWVKLRDDLKVEYPAWFLEKVGIA